MRVEEMIKIVNPLSPKGIEEDIKTVLYVLAAQGGSDGYPYDQMQLAADYICSLENEINNLKEFLTINGLDYLKTEEESNAKTKRTGK